MGVHRPRGVNIIIVTLIFLTVLGILWGIQLVNTGVPIDYLIILRLQTIVGIYTLIQDLHTLELWRFFGMAFLASSILSLITVAGLLHMKKWSYYLALIMGILATVGGVLGILIYYFYPLPDLMVSWFIPLLALPANVITIIFGTTIILYLLGEAQYSFGKQIDRLGTIINRFGKPLIIFITITFIAGIILKLQASQEYANALYWTLAYYYGLPSFPYPNPSIGIPYNIYTILTSTPYQLAQADSTNTYSLYPFIIAGIILTLRTIVLIYRNR